MNTGENAFDGRNADEYYSQLEDLRINLAEMSMNLITQAVNLAMAGAWSSLNREMAGGDSIPLCLEESANQCSIRDIETI